MSTQKEDTHKVGAGRLAAIYTRKPVGSDRDKTPVNRQLELCEQLAMELGYDTSEDLTFVDDGPPTSDSRPGLMALMQALVEGRAEAVIVDKVDRIARYETKMLELFLQGLRHRQIPIYVARMPRGYRYDLGSGRIVRDDPEHA